MWPEVTRIMQAIRAKKAFTMPLVLHHVGPREAKALQAIGRFLRSSKNWVSEPDGVDAIIWRPQHESLTGGGTLS